VDGQLTASAVSIAQYLSDPAYERLEYVDGELRERHVGSKSHARVQANLSHKLVEYVRAHPPGYVAAELRVKLAGPSGVEFRLPDLAVVLEDTSPEEEYLDRAPDLAVEIRSPGDSIADLLRKMELYFAHGARLGWIVLPEERSVLVATPDGAVRAVTAGETLDGGALLPGLLLPVAEIFG
jgi:Uma2 family endonuclease